MDISRTSHRWVTPLIVLLCMTSALGSSFFIKSGFFAEVSSIKGTAASTYSASSSWLCALRAIMDFENSSGIMFRGTRMDNCHVIQCGGEDTFVSQGENSVFRVNRQYDEHFPPVVYFHFETDQCWINHGAQFVMEELTFAKANTVIMTDHTMQQYLEFGNQSQACITIPESCGTEGGTVSVWVKPLDCQAHSGIISSQDPPQSAFVIACRPTELVYAIDQPNGNYFVVTAKPTGWVHAVMVYHGVEQGITAYQDGSKVGTETSRNPFSRPSGNGEVVIGRRLGNKYASVYLDEIKMYNRQLSQDEILNMY